MSTHVDLRRDIPAGVVVFFVAVPLCLGIALASGAPLFAGLIAGMVGGVIVGAISGSPLGVSGPAAGLAVIVLNAIEDLGSFEAFLLAVLFAGAVQIALGLMRAGVLAYFFPSSVIKGMLSGIGLLIILKQIPHAVGWDADPEGDLAFRQPDGETTFSELGNALQHVEPAAIFVAATALAILLLWDRVLGPRAAFFRVVQGPLVAVAFGVGYQLLTRAFAPEWALEPSHLVQVPVPDGLSGLSELVRQPDWSRLGDSAIYATAVTIAVVASLETLLCVEATDKLDPDKRVTPTNRELVAQGVGNMVCGMVGGLPVTQVIVRSSANIQSNAASKTSTIVHGLLIALFVVVLPTVLNLIPLAVLASILLVVGYKLATPALFKRMYALGNSQFAPFIVTILGMVLTDLLTGVGMGLVLATSILLYRHYTVSHSLEIESRDEHDEHRVRIRLAEQVSFLSRGAILRELSQIPDGSHVVIDLSKTRVVDHDVLEILREFEESADHRDIEVRRIDPVAMGPIVVEPA